MPFDPKGRGILILKGKRAVVPDCIQNVSTETRPVQAAIRTIRHDERSEVLRLLTEAYGGFYDTTETGLFLSSQRFDPNGCFVVENNGSLTGCVAVTKLPRDRWFVIRFLTVRDADSKAKDADRLLEEALRYAKSENAEFLRATTPAIEPYMTVLRRSGFKPVRRDFRIGWEILSEEEANSRSENSALTW